MTELRIFKNGRQTVRELRPAEGDDGRTRPEARRDGEPSPVKDGKGVIEPKKAEEDTTLECIMAENQEGWGVARMRPETGTWGADRPVRNA